METSVTVQVHALKPSWIRVEQNKYRLYVNGDLITERDWIWDLNTYIEEKFFINAKRDSIVNIRLDPLIIPQISDAEFVLQNLKVNDIYIPTEASLQLSFKIYKYNVPRKKYEKPRISKRRI
jgi:hypothetical protein